MGCLKLEILDNFIKPKFRVQRPCKIVEFSKVNVYLNGRLLNMIDPSGMMADSSGGSGRLPGAPESSASPSSRESIPLNQFQVPMVGSGGSKGGSSNFNDSPNVKYAQTVASPNTARQSFPDRYGNYQQLARGNADSDHTIESLVIPLFKPVGWAFKGIFSARLLAKTAQLDADVAKTFQFGRYSEIALKKPLILSRYYDGVNAFAKGRFMTNSISRSPILDRIGMAIRPSWNNMTSVAKWEIPAGSTIYKGRAAMQFPWLGGKTQYFIPRDILNASKQLK